MLWEYIKSDLFRYAGSVTFMAFCKHYIISPGFKYSFYLRLCMYFKQRNKPIYLLIRLILRHYSYKFGFDIPTDVKIGYGFYIGHFGSVIISSKAIIGNNVNISQGVTIGYNGRGKKQGYPIIKDNVFIGPGAVIIGGILIDNNVCIGANAVVRNNCFENETIVGVPGKMISKNGSEGMILNKWILKEDTILN